MNKRNRGQSEDIVKLYCYIDGCRCYVTIRIGYNGSAKVITGKHKDKRIDLRNQMYLCNKHK